MRTELKERILWFDGTSQVSPELVPGLFLKGVTSDRIVVSAVNEDVLQFNAIADVAIEFGKSANKSFNMEYQIPREYKNIDLAIYVQIKLEQRQLELNVLYNQRVAAELNEIRLRGMELLVKTLIYVVDRLKETNTIWGVGRGSSCASLVLFLIDLHKVDPIKYNIPMEEFFHE